ncbi:MAG: hypothetical protein H3C47_09135 [Candidatus Cloacimonetes bacterium]|nr:hypothetical protein [Candidatus Cloacimonadota bacterium]
MGRKNLLYALAVKISQVSLNHPVRVGIDGVDASGKTRFADDLAQAIQAVSDRFVIRASIDDFHQPRAIRLANGDDSPEGYYQRAFDLDSVKNLLLHPLGPGGDLKIKRAVFDYRTDKPIVSDWQIVARHSVLIMDGVFLHRSELRGFWDWSIFLHVPFDVTIQRAILRDGDLFGQEDQIRQRYDQKYIPAQKMYLQWENPSDKATVVIDNSDFDEPVVIQTKWQVL